MCGPKNPGCGCSSNVTAAPDQEAVSSAKEVAGAAASSDLYTEGVRFISQPSQSISGDAVTNQAGHVPGMLPGQVISSNGSLALYEDLYGAVDQYNNPAVMSLPGTWGGHFAAGKAR